MPLPIFMQILLTTPLQSSILLSHGPKIRPNLLIPFLPIRLTIIPIRTLLILLPTRLIRTGRTRRRSMIRGPAILQKARR